VVTRVTRDSRLGTRGVSLALLAAFLFCGCDEEFKPPSIVGGLRVLGARAEPAEIRPGAVAQLEALVVDPARAGKPTVFWIACDPDPFNQGRTSCNNTETFEDPTSIDLSTGELPPGMHFVGLGDRAAYAAPPTLFDVLSQDDPIRQEGTVALVLILAIGEEVSPLAPREELAAVFQRVRDKETQAVVALFRVMVSEKSAPNRNPSFGSVRYGDDAPPAGAHLLFAAGEKRNFVVTATDESYEAYRQLTPSGVVDKVERAQVAWFSTSGRFSEDRLALDSEIPEEFTAPGFDPKDLVPANRLGTTWAVLRDTRGGISWREQPFYSCSDTFAHPTVRNVLSPVNPADPLVLEGDDLKSIVDVIVNGVVVKGSFIAASGRWEGEPRGIPSGTWPLELRSADCTSGAVEGTSVAIP
jgi:hypothetical protein